MADYQFLQNPLTKRWVIFSPRRAKRPDIAKGIEPVCPFCPNKESKDKEVYRFPSLTSSGETLESWKIRVVHNKFPFAPIHEVIIHSSGHYSNFDKLPKSQVELILKTYRQRYNEHKNKGQVYIFHNHGEGGGESLPHPHSQLAVIPGDIKTDLPRLASDDELAEVTKGEGIKKTKYFNIFCPKTSQWPDEVWIAPHGRGKPFGEIEDKEIEELAFVLPRLIQIFDMRHGMEFPFNFYIYPGGDWYMRIVPRVKNLGGFEVGTGIFVNTQEPIETINFIKKHFDQPIGGSNEKEIKTVDRAAYHKAV